MYVNNNTHVRIYSNHLPVMHLTMNFGRFDFVCCFTWIFHIISVHLHTVCSLIPVLWYGFWFRWWQFNVIGGRGNWENGIDIVTLKRVLCYFEEGGVVLWRGWCGTLKRAVWYFEVGSVLLWRGWCCDNSMLLEGVENGIKN